MPGIPFRPFRGLEKTILSQRYTEGTVYFATDTGKMYLDVDGVRKPLGGSGAAVYYASATEVVERADGTYNLAYSDMDDDNAELKIDDLIINSDGRFFRVLKADKESGIVNCSLIAVSGTGGGGGGIGPGGGGGGTGGTTAGVKLEAVDQVPSTFIYGQPYVLRFKATATNDNQVYITYTIQSDISGNRVLPTRTIRSGEIDSIDIGSILPAETGLAIRVDATSDNDGTATPLIYRYRSSIELILRESKNFNPLTVQTGALSFSCIPVGAGLDKTLRIYIDGAIRNDLTQIVTTSEREVAITIDKQSHGVHTLRAVLSTGQGLNEISAPALEYEIAWDTGEGVPLIWCSSSNPSSIVNHERLNLQYMVYDPNKPTTEVHFYMSGDEIATSPQNITYSNTNWMTWNVIGYKLGQNLLTITCGSAQKLIEVQVEEDTARDMDIVQNNLYISLDSAGRSNRENPTSRAGWSYQNRDGVTTNAILSGFNWYNNGWISDEDGNTCLRVSNGAKVSIPLNIMNTTKLENGLTFETMFKVRNVQSYKTLITTDSQEDEDGNVTITKIVNDNESVFMKYYNSGIGMCLGTQEAFFRTQRDVIVSARYKEDEIITVSFVLEPQSASAMPLIYMYINGIMSGIVTYDKNTDSFASEAKAIEINSDYCDIDIYKVRVYYKTALSSTDVVHNYIADKQDTALYDMNEIVSFSNGIPSVDFNLLMTYNNNHPENPSLPYAILEVPNGEHKDLLPYYKGDKVNLNVEFRNVWLDNALERGDVTPEQYITSCPSFSAKGAEFNVQGTSSQGYPRRNYKGKFKKAEWTYTNGPLAGLSLLESQEYNGKKYKKYYMDNTQAAESTFTWKADYMDSSNTHNTGFASFVKTMYNEHPLTYLSSSMFPHNDVTELRTTIYGFPMIVFQKHVDGTYEYIGRYNFNLDKGCNSVLGFERDEEHPYVDGKSIAEVAECWELKNNQGTRCAFTKTDFSQTVDGTDNTELTIHDDFEYRYSYYEDDIDDCLDAAGDFTGTTQKARNDYMLERFANLEKVANWLKSCDTGLGAEGLGQSLPEPVMVGDVQYDTDNAEYRYAKFRKEFPLHFNMEYCLVYFVMTELLLCYDSRGKNMMLATWGPNEKGGEYIWYPIFYDIDTQLGINNSGVPTWDYDINATVDGQFSTSNSVLWNNFYHEFFTEIKDKYAELRGSKLNFENLNGYYSFDPAVSKSPAMQGCRPINVINIDEYFKYIAPTFSGYTNTQGETALDQGKHFYCLQGTRQLQRELFLRNRFNFLDSIWQAGTYAVEGARGIQFRFNANSTGTSDTFLDKEFEPEQYPGYTHAAWPQPLDTNLEFKITPYLKQGVFVYYDERSNPATPIMFDGDQSVTVPNPADMMESIKNQTNFTQQLIYVGGAPYISSLGDLGNKYFDEIFLSDAIRLRDLTLGSDVEGYYNTKLNESNFQFGDSAVDAQGRPNASAKALLQKVVLTGLTQLGSIFDVSGSEKLKEFRALRTRISGVSLADGTQIEILHLPNTTSRISFIEPVALKGLLTDASQLKNEDGSYKPGIYIQDITDKTEVGEKDTTAISYFSIVGGQMGYDSYRLLDKICSIKDKMHARLAAGESMDAYNPRLSIQLEDVHWSPYTLVEYGEAASVDKTYVKKTEHYTFESYKPGAEWDNDTLNGRIYEVDNTILQNDSTVITDTSLLDKFIASYQTLENYYRSVTEYPDGRATIPTITGELFIKNGSGPAIKEVDIKNKYIDTYWPDLHIFAENVEEAYVAKFVEILDNGAEYEWDTHRYDQGTTEHPRVSEVTPVKLHYDFVGWGPRPDTSPEEVITDWNTYTYDASHKSYTFYAIYKIHNYTVKFYNGEDVIETLSIPYNQNLTNSLKLPYMDDSALDLERCYAFIGWTDDKTRSGLVTNEGMIVNVPDLKATKDFNFYACFQEMSVYDNTLSARYFTATEIQGGYVDDLETSYNVPDAVTLQVARGITLQGKITIPNIYEYNGSFRPVASIVLGNTLLNQSQPGITHVFFANHGSNLRRLGSNAFNNCTNLRYVELPDNLRVIYDGAFSNCSKLENNYIGKNIYRIGILSNGGFNTSINTNNFTFTIDGTVTQLSSASAVLSYCNVRLWQQLTLGSPEHPWTINLTRKFLTANQEGPANPGCRPHKLTVYIPSGRESEPQQWLDAGYFDVSSSFELEVIPV